MFENHKFIWRYRSLGIQKQNCRTPCFSVFSSRRKRRIQRRGTCQLLFESSSFSSFHKASFTSEMPICACADMNSRGTSALRLFRIFFNSSGGTRSHLETTSSRCLSSSSGLYCFSSLSRMWYSFRISSESTGTRNISTELRSMWRRKRRPKPFPSEAPSMMPGISATTKEYLSR